MSAPATGTGPNSIYVSGKYAYVANYGSNSLSIIDVSNPSSPSTVSTPSTGGSLPNAVRVSGRYAYVTNNNDSVLSVLDVSNPSSVVVSTSVIPSSPGLLGLYISGRYAYLAEYNLSSVSIYDIGGLETNGAIIASLEAGNAQIRNDLTVQGNIFTQALNAVSAYVENLSAKVLSLSSLALGAASNVATNALLSLNLATSGTELVTKNSTAAFSVSGSTATVGVATSSNMISLSLASTTSIGNGTMTAGPSLASGNISTGAHAIQRPDGKVLVVNGGGTATTNIYDPATNTFTAGPNLNTGTAGYGAHSILRPDGKFLVVNGNTTATTNIYDPVANTFVAGPTLSSGSAQEGAHSILRPDGKFLVVNGNNTNVTNIYDPVANSFTTGPTLATGNAYTGSYSIQRPDGKFLLINGGTATNIYDPIANIFVAGPSVATGAVTRGPGAVQLPDGRFLLVNGNGTTATNMYDPVANTFTAGPTITSGNPYLGGHFIQRPDGKFLMVNGNISAATKIYDPSTNSFSSGPNLATGSVELGGHSFQRPDGKYVILNGNGTAATNIYDPAFIMSGTYESEDINITDLNPSSVLNFTTNGEGKIEVAIKTATSTAALAASYTTYATTTNGSKFFPVSGAQYAKVRVTLTRFIPTNRQPMVNAKESNVWRGDSDIKYVRSFANPILYSFNISNQKGYHVTNTDFGTNSASTTLTSNATSGPVVSGLMTGNDGLTLPYSSTNNLDLAKGVFTGGPILASGNSGIGTFSIQRPDGKYLVVNGGSTATTNILDPVTMTFTAGPSLASGTVQGGGHAIQRPDGKFLIVNGNNTTTTNVYDPIANTMSVGPAVVSGTPYYGANSLQRPDGKFLIIVGNTSTATNIYDPITNTMTAGPNLTANAYVGSFSIQRPDGKFLIIVGNTVSTTNIYDPISNTMTAGPNLASYVGWGGHAVQRPDGKIIIVHGAGLSSTTLYDPSVIDTSNTLPVGPNLYSASNYGAHAIQRPDGTYLFIAGAGNTGTSIYDPNGNTFYNGNAVVSGNIQYNSHSIHLPDGRFLVINGDGSTATNIYNAGYLVRGYYESEFINDTTLDSNSTFTWKGNADAYKSGVVSVRVRTATSTNALQTATWRTLPVSGSRINPGTSETWMQVKFEMNRPIANQSGIAKTVIKGESVYYNRFPLTTTTQNQASVFVKPTIYSYAIQKQEGQDLATFQVNGNSVFRFSATGDAYTSAGGSWNAGGADVAEYFPTEDGLLEPGDIVSVSSTPDGLVRMTTESYDEQILGIVTTAPGLRLGSDDIGANQGKQPIALAGRVPVKVSLENGVIKKGDYLTSSSRPGFAMKALDAGRVIGIALEDYTLEMDTQNNGAGKVLTFVNPHFYMGATFTEKVTSTFSRFATMIQKGVAELGVTITDAGNIGVGTTNPLSRFHVAGDARLGVASTTSGALIFQNEANGYVTTLRSATSTLTSDLTLTLPDSLGKTAQALMTDGAGYTYWGTVARVNDTDIKEGYLPRFLNDGSLATGSFLDDGVVTGINATSTDTTFTVKSTASTTYAFSVFSTENNPLFAIGNDGVFSFGTDVVVASGGDIFTKGTLATEAEGVSSMYTAIEALDIGTVVAFADIDTVGTSTQATSTESMFGVQKATSTLDAVGIVAARSGLTLGTSTVNAVPVAFAGRVPVKVTTENGEVKRGDYLTVSRTIPGYAMKLTGEGKAIGRAISDYVSGNDKVMILVENGYQKLNLLGTTASTTGMLTTGNVDLNANGVAIYNIKSLASANGTWSIDENGRIVGKTLCIEDVCIDKATLTNILQATGQISVAAPPSPVTGTSTGETGGGIEGETNQTDTGTSTEPGLSEGSQSEDLEGQPEVSAENQGAGEDDTSTEVATPSSPEPVEVVPVVQTDVTPPAAPEAPVTQTDAASGESVL
jgi:YVTN family beta-propeller protein